jgi:hypothetical protein
MNLRSGIRCAAVAAALGVAALSFAMPSPAHAWWRGGWRGGFFVGIPPVVVGPPAVYAPPLYGPPPLYGAPPAYQWQQGPQSDYPDAYQTPPDYGSQYSARPYNPPQGYEAPPDYGSQYSVRPYNPPQAYEEPPDYGSQYPPPLSNQPQAYQTPPNYGSPSTGQSCQAGGYVCPLERPAPAGAACSCPSNRGGRVWGHTPG